MPDCNGLVGVEPRSNIISRESGQTSLWPFVTRTSGKPTQETKQMTAALTAAVSHHLRGASTPGQYRQVHASRCERVLKKAFERLELHDMKVSRAVLRGLEGITALQLPDLGQEYLIRDYYRQAA